MHAHMGARWVAKAKLTGDAFALRPLRPLAESDTSVRRRPRNVLQRLRHRIMADAVGMPEYAPIRLEAAGQLDLPIERMTA